MTIFNSYFDITRGYIHWIIVQNPFRRRHMAFRTQRSSKHIPLRGPQNRGVWPSRVSVFHWSQAIYILYIYIYMFYMHFLKNSLYNNGSFREISYHFFRKYTCIYTHTHIYIYIHILCVLVCVWFRLILGIHIGFEFPRFSQAMSKHISDYKIQTIAGLPQNLW